MSSKLVAVVIIGGLCVAAAGGGAYLAVRQGAQAAATPTAATHPAAPGQAVAPVTPAEPAPSVATPAPAAINREGGIPAAPSSSPVPVAVSTHEQIARPAAAPRPALVPARPVTAAPRATAQPMPIAQDAASASDPAPAAQQAPSPFIPSRPTLENVPAEEVPAGQAPEPAPVLEELLVPADAVIGLQVERTISTDVARIEDRVDARVTRDVRVAGQVAIPAGARARGTVTFVDPGGKFKERARLGVRFHTILLADGTVIPIQAETIFREGSSPAGDSAAKIGGGAIGGAIIGAILGGGKGAAIGGSLGAGAGTAAASAGRPNAATLASGSTVTVRLSQPATVTIEKHEH